MENKNESVEVKTKNITFGLVVGWILGVLFGIVGLTTLFTSTLSGILFLVMAFITLPVTDNIIKNKLKISLSKGLKIFFVIILLIMSGYFSAKNTDNHFDTLTKQANEEFEKNVSKIPVDVLLARELASAYKANEVAADIRYKGKLIEIMGTVDSIGKDILDTPYVTLKTDEYSIVGVQCLFNKDSEAQLATLSKGQSITLIGTVSGKMMNVIIDDCSIKN